VVRRVFYCSVPYLFIFVESLWPVAFESASRTAAERAHLRTLEGSLISVNEMYICSSTIKVQLF
jgi:hypothetical protein